MIRKVFLLSFNYLLYGLYTFHSRITALTIFLVDFYVGLYSDSLLFFPIHILVIFQSNLNSTNVWASSGIVFVNFFFLNGPFFPVSLYFLWFFLLLLKTGYFNIITGYLWKLISLPCPGFAGLDFWSLSLLSASAFTEISLNTEHLNKYLSQFLQLALAGVCL